MYKNVIGDINNIKWVGGGQHYKPTGLNRHTEHSNKQ